MKLIASLAPARAEIEAGIVDKADQQFAQKKGQFWGVLVPGICLELTISSDGDCGNYATQIHFDFDLVC